MQYRYETAVGLIGIRIIFRTLAPRRTRPNIDHRCGAWIDHD